ncbi:MAG TPA: hypothetical protein VM263_08570 [Acidimicrobiales bacterium]|nr:hypothetical protein [Acidimicrobiales bacterium]
MPSRPPTEPRSAFGQVVVAAGHMVDVAGRSPPRFPASDEEAVTRAVGEALDRWGVSRGTLLVCGGARGADIIAAEQALARGAAAWLLVALPEEAFLATSVELPGSDWAERYRALRRRCPTWFQPDELPPAAPGEDVFERNNDWCLEVAGAQAPPGGLRVLAVWDRSGGDGRGGTADLVERARRAGATVEVIGPPGARR